jgi:hypothetical protein
MLDVKRQIERVVAELAILAPRSRTSSHEFASGGIHSLARWILQDTSGTRFQKTNDVIDINIVRVLGPFLFRK